MKLWPFKRRLVVDPVAHGPPLKLSPLKRRPTAHHAHEQPATRGMWVMWRGQAGILTGGDERGLLVMLVQADGTNHGEIVAPADELRQCWLSEIPLARRPDAARGARLGYHEQ